MERLVRAACSDQIATTIEVYPERRAELLEKWPDYDPRKIRMERKNIVTQRNDSLLLGATILPLIKETATGEHPALPSGMSRMSWDQIICYLWPQRPGEPEASYFDRVHDIEKRKVRSRFKVAHLAAAALWLAREMEVAGQPLNFDYQDLAFLRRWVAMANIFADQIRATPMLARAADKLIELVWIEPTQNSAPANQA